MAADKQPHSLAHLLGTGEFSIAVGAASLAAAQLIGWEDFDNVTTFSIQAKSEKVEHKGSYRGVRRRDVTKFKETTAGYQLKFDTLNPTRVGLLYYGTVGTNYTQVVRAAVAADALSSPVKGRWYDLNIAGVRVRELTLVTIVMGSGSVTEDTDYVIDYKLGRIYWKITPGAITSITLTAPAILVSSANTFARITPMDKPSLKGMARLTIWNDDGALVLDHHDFYCEMFPEGDFSVGDDIAEMTHTVNILTPVGTVGVVPGAV